VFRNARRLDLLLPGLSGPLPRGTDAPAVRAPATETLLARARVSAFDGTDLEQTLCALFGVATGDSGDLPSAPLCHLAQTGVADGAFRMHADPVFLRPDQDRLLLFDSRHLALDAGEAAEFSALFNRHFAKSSWRLEAPEPGHWYLRLPRAPALTTQPLHRVIGRNIDRFLPEGEEARKWRGILNEVQMLFHQADVNRRREQAGRAPVNSLWFWGGGHLPSVPPSRYAALFADQPLARGLAIAAGVPGYPTGDATAWLDATAGDGLILLDHFWWPILDADAPGWARQLERLEPFMVRCRRELHRRSLGTLNLYPCDGRNLQLTPRSLHRFWIRRRSVAAWLRP